MYFTKFPIIDYVYFTFYYRMNKLGEDSLLHLLADEKESMTHLS